MKDFKTDRKRELKGCGWHLERQNKRQLYNDDVVKKIEILPVDRYTP